MLDPPVDVSRDHVLGPPDAEVKLLGITDKPVSQREVEAAAVHLLRRGTD